MAIAYRGATSNSAANGGDVALDLSTISGLAENDIVMSFVSVEDRLKIRHTFIAEIRDVELELDQTSLPSIYP